MPPIKNLAIMGRKVGMSRWFQEDGTNIPVTVIEAGPCVVTQVKTFATDGYAAIQFGFEDAKVRRVAMPQIGHDAKAGTAPKRFHREFRCESDAEAEGFEAGQIIDVSVFEGIKFVDVTGTSKGKGFQGAMKRYNFIAHPGVVVKRTCALRVCVAARVCDWQAGHSCEERLTAWPCIHLV